MRISWVDLDSNGHWSSRVFRLFLKMTYNPSDSLVAGSNCQNEWMNKWGFKTFNENLKAAEKKPLWNSDIEMNE